MEERQKHTVHHCVKATEEDKLIGPKMKNACIKGAAEQCDYSALFGKST